MLPDPLPVESPLIEPIDNVFRLVGCAPVVAQDPGDESPLTSQDERHDGRSDVLEKRHNWTHLAPRTSLRPGPTGVVVDQENTSRIPDSSHRSRAVWQTVPADR